MVKVGDRLFVAEPSHRKAAPIKLSWVTVTKIGRRWVEFQPEDRRWRLAEDRFDIETMKLDGRGFGATGKVYPSEEAYRTEVRVKALWREFRGRFDRIYEPPEGVDEIRILKAADALGIKLESE